MGIVRTAPEWDRMPAYVYVREEKKERELCGKVATHNETEGGGKYENVLVKNTLAV